MLRDTVPRSEIRAMTRMGYWQTGQRSGSKCEIGIPERIQQPTREKRKFNIQQPTFNIQQPGPVLK